VASWILAFARMTGGAPRLQLTFRLAIPILGGNVRHRVRHASFSSRGSRVVRRITGRITGLRGHDTNYGFKTGQIG
jgi:hypothetical protein